MKVRTRSFKKVQKEGSVWSSFVDIMSTVCLVFFFVMILAIGMFVKVKDAYDNIAKQREELYMSIEKELKPTLGEKVSYDNGKLEITSSVLFQTDSWGLTDDGIYVAQQVGEAFIKILNNPDYAKKIESVGIIGHTDNDADGTYNRTLSTNRAVAFVNAMLNDSKSDSPFGQYFLASGMSKYEPIQGDINSQNEDQKQMNRRIEIKINFSDSDIVKAITQRN